jgi:hypothetical protein
VTRLAAPSAAAQDDCAAVVDEVVDGGLLRVVDLDGQPAGRQRRAGLPARTASRAPTSTARRARRRWLAPRDKAGEIDERQGKRGCAWQRPIASFRPLPCRRHESPVGGRGA